MPLRSRTLWIITLLALSPALLPAQPPATHQTASAILAQLRLATGGSAWDHLAEIRTEGTLLLAGKSGSFTYARNLATGATVIRAQVPDLDFQNNEAIAPTEDWQLDNAGNVGLKPGSADPREIDDLYIARNAWWQPNFAGAAVTVLPPATTVGSTCDLLQFKVPGGAGFTLCINRATHLLDRIVTSADTITLSDYRPGESGLVLPFRRQIGSAANAPVLITTHATLSPQVNPADFEPPFARDYTMPASGQVTVPTENGLIVKTRLNGQGPFRAVFDTGAVNVLSAGFAHRLGLHVEDKPIHFGAIGGAITVHTAKVDTLAIGDLTVRDQVFYVIDMPSDAGSPELLIGYELMRRFAVRIDFEHSRLTFLDAPTFHYTGTGARVPLILHKNSNSIEVSAEADGIPGIFTLDSGNQTGLFLNSKFVNDHDLVATLNAHLRGYNGRGLGGPSPEAWFTRLHNLRLGSLEIARPVVRLQSKSDGGQNENAGNIGQSILFRFTLTLDCMRGAMYLDRTPDSDKPEVFNRAGILFDPVEGVDHVMTIFPGSPGEVAGLKPGDTITAIDGHPPADDPNDTAFNQPIGTILHLTITRHGVPQTIAITLRDVL